MARVSGDPEEIEAFAQMLAEFADDTQDSLTEILNMYEETDWDDPRYQASKDKFESVADACRLHCSNIESNHLSVLRRRVQMLRDYLSR